MTKKEKAIRELIKQELLSLLINQRNSHRIVARKEVYNAEYLYAKAAGIQEAIDIVNTKLI